MRESQIRREVVTPFVRGLSTIIGAVERESLRRRAQPYLWQRFHERMHETLPQWRWAARAHHKRMGRRYAAMVWATSKWAYDYVCQRGCDDNLD
jgi:hypothetical protein